MLDICIGSSKEFKRIVHKLLDIVVEHFIEIGSNLDYEEIYGAVFPSHMEDDKEFGLKLLKKLHRHINNNFNHPFPPLDEFVLYHILLWVYESSEDGFPLNDVVEDYYLSGQTTERMDDDELKLLKNIQTPYDLVGICFEDVDFLDIGEILEMYKVNPEIITDFFHIDLDYYKELMPEDMLLEYRNIKEQLESIKEIRSKVTKKEQFSQIVNDLVKTFDYHVVHKKVHTVINNSSGELNEKEVQALFGMYAKLYLEKYDIVVSPEVDTGRGTVDFHLSYGLEHQALLEFKLGSHKRVNEGIKYQLPIYLIAERIDFGIFVLICCSEEVYKAYDYLYKEAEELSEKYKKDISFFRIDASGSSKTGSKIKKEEEMKLEGERNSN